MTRQEIESHTIEFLRTAGGTRPDVRVVDIDGKRAVVKDFKRSDLLFRLLIGPILIKRERKALEQLKDVEGVPRLLSSIDRYAIAIEHIPAPSLYNIDGPPPPGFFRELAGIMDEVHKRGVVHCDLRSSGNVLMDENGRPRVVDFAAAIVRGRGLNPLVNCIFRQFVDADMKSVLILKRKHAPERLTPDEITRLNTLLPFENTARKLGSTMRRITRFLLTKKRKT